MQCIVYDLEATCWDGEPYADQSEIIEIAAYKVDRYGKITGPFQSFVKPMLFPKLSPFCRRLTTISQSEIDKAPQFGEVLDNFLDWVGDFHEETVFCAWGKYDPRMLIRDCDLHDYPDDWLVNTFNVKSAYRDLKGHNRAVGLIKGCEIEDIDFEGIPHRAIWDSYNLLQLFMKYYKSWEIPI